MELCCTKKLLEYMECTPEKASEEVAPVFAWSANLLVIDRRKALVVAHPASRCGFVLYGFTAKDKLKLPQLVLQGIRKVLESEYVCPEIIERYLADLGTEVTLRANSSQKAVARCNQVCARVKYFSELLEPDELFQQDILRILNEDVVPTGKYLYAYEVLIGLLQEQYGENIQRCRALELEVTLNLHTPCTRRIIVPDDLNFYQFHRVLQKCFCWENCHLHHFVTAVDERGYPTQIIRPEWGDDGDSYTGIAVKSSHQMHLSDVFPSKKAIVYEYDFGDSWYHVIRLCRVIDDCRDPYPRCIMAEGTAPVEDCGGADGFAYMQNVLKDPKHPEYEDLTDWLGSYHFYPPNVTNINFSIRNAHRCPFPIW